MIKFTRFTVLLLIFTTAVCSVSGQTTLTGANVITTAVPFLSITPDSRAGGMGDAGVATTPDVNSQHWNPAKYAFMESDMGVGISYSPWLRALVNDINLAYLVGYKKIDEQQTVSSSLRYFSLGDIVFMSPDAQPMGQHNPNEFAIDIAYTRLLSETFSGSVALRYIRSDLTAGQYFESSGQSSAGNSYAADVAFYYYNEFRAGRKDNIFSAGINISNIGAKISYTDGEVKDFIPTNLKLGANYKAELDDYNTIAFTVDINKLLVPTPPKDTVDYEDSIIFPGGINSDKSPIAGIFTSFGDAPGGLSEELQEINLSVGVEYWYNEQFAIRAGYFYEHENKGNRKFLTAGAGLRLNVFALDFSYLLPTVRNHPLENTLRFTLSFDVDAFGRQNR